MYILSIISFLLLGGFLLLTAIYFSIPSMMSDIYYQLQNCADNEVIGDKRKRNYGWVFTLVMFLSAILMLIPLLDSGKGIQFLAFLGCAGLMFVGFVPRYLDSTEHIIHKSAAITAAIGCVGWCVSVSIIPTLVILTTYLAYAYHSRRDKASHPWYWVEVCGFIDMFTTYAIIHL